MSEENALATKADVQAVKTELKAEVQAVKAELQSLRSEVKTDLEALETHVVERLLEAVHDVETRVLNAFYGFAQTNQKRLTLLEGTDSNLISRLGTVERLNIPPAA